MSKLHVTTAVIDMGRTIRTFRNAIDSEEERWRNYRRTLRPVQREYFDQIFEYARRCADAGSMITTPRVTEVVLISAMIEILGEMDALRDIVFNEREITKAKRT